MDHSVPDQFRLLQITGRETIVSVEQDTKVLENELGNSIADLRHRKPPA